MKLIKSGATLFSCSLLIFGEALSACSESEEAPEPRSKTTVVTPNEYAAKDDGFTVLGHRGALHHVEPTLYTQNSIAAFRRAALDGAPGIEFDVVWTKDRKNLVFHDSNLSSTVCQGDPDGAVEELTAKEVRKRCVLLNGETISTLEEMLSVTGTWFDIFMLEVKDAAKTAPEIEAQTRAAILAVRNAGLLNKTIFISYAARATEVIGQEQKNGVIGAWDDYHGTQQLSALAAPHSYYGSEWHHFIRGEINVDLFEETGKELFAYTLDKPQHFNRLFATGVRILLSNDVATAVAYRRWNPIRGTDDVGVLSDVGCPSDSEEVVIAMDDEDDDNQNLHDGWLGATTSDSNTTMRFCRVEGSRLHPIADSSHTAADFAVLKLSDTCPKGSIEFQRYLDNEDVDNENYALGDTRPYISEENTTLSFCQFKSDPASGVASLPNLGFSYGVFATPSFAYGSRQGWFYTDDQDNDDAASASTSSGADAIARQIVGDGQAANLGTLFNVWRR